MDVSRMSQEMIQEYPFILQLELWLFVTLEVFLR